MSSGTTHVSPELSLDWVVKSQPFLEMIVLELHLFLGLGKYSMLV